MKLSRQNIKWHAISKRGRNHAVFIIDTMVNALAQRYDKKVYGVDLVFKEYRQLDKKREISEHDYQAVVDKLLYWASDNPEIIKRIPSISLKLISALDKKIRGWQKSKPWKSRKNWEYLIEDFFILVSKIWCGALGYSYIFLGERVAPLFIDEVIKLSKGKLSAEEAMFLLQPNEQTEMSRFTRELADLSALLKKKKMVLVAKKLKFLKTKYGYLGRYYFHGSGYDEKSLLSLVNKITTKNPAESAVVKKGKRIKLTPKLKTLDEGFRRYALMSNKADEAVNKGIETLQPLWHGIAEEFGIKYEHVANMRAVEIIESLKSRHLVVDKSELSRRTKDHLFWLHSGEIILDTRKLYKKELDLEKKIDSVEITTIKGQSASVRRNVIGKVRILHASKEISKLRSGEILVTTMTNPEFLPAMQKAAGFVTDDGGLLCHAAIVARELKKPCIIGTKIATQVLKDGDMVEVDADKGIVRILKKK